MSDVDKEGLRRGGRGERRERRPRSNGAAAKGEAGVPTAPSAPSAGSAVEAVVEPAADLGTLSYRQLIWRRFRKRRLALFCGGILLAFYVVALGAGFFAPYHYNAINMRLRHVPPQLLRLSWKDGLHVHGLKSVRNTLTLELEFTPDASAPHPVGLFHRDAEGRL
ncbi:MAG: hypothetical protein ACYSU0_01615, partial [Planctomycetota bacterium]